MYYNIGKDFNPKTSDAPAYSMGLGRSHFEKLYIESAKTIDKNVPGPGIYTTTKPFGSESLKFSMSFR